MKAIFPEVMASILSERGYQAEKWKNLDPTNTLDDFVTYIQKYANSFDPTWSDQEKLDNFRKVAALGFAAMEFFGAPQREGFEVKFERIPPDCFPSECNTGKACDQCPMDEGQLPLAPEDLDVLVQDGQVAKVVERGVYYRVNETERTYLYDEDDGETTLHTFYDVRAFAVMPTGGHRLIDKYGTGFYVQPGWTVLEVPNCECV